MGLLTPLPLNPYLPSLPTYLPTTSWYLVWCGGLFVVAAYIYHGLSPSGDLI